MGSPVTGIDPDYLALLKAYAAQMAPSDADKKQALIQGLLGMSASALSNAYKPWQLTAGAAMQGGLGGYNQELARQEALRNQNLGQAAQIMNIGKQNQMLQMQMNAYGQIKDALGGGSAAPQPNPAKGLLGGVSDAMSGIDPTAGAVLSGIAQGQADAVPGAAGPPADLRDRLARANLLGTVAGMKDLSGAIDTMYPKGIALRAGAGLANPITGAILNANPAAPPGMYFDPSTNTYKTVPGGPEAFAAQAGRVTGSTEQAKSEHDLIPVPMGDGTTQQMTRSDAVKYLQQQRQPLAPPQSQGSLPPQINIVGNPPAGPMQREAMQFGGPAAAAPSAAAPLSPTLGRTPSPVALKAAEEEATGRAKSNADVYTNINKTADTAMSQDARVSEMEKLIPSIPFGKTGTTRQTLAEYALDIPKVGNTLANVAVPNAQSAVPAMQVFGKMASQMVIEQSKQLGTREAASVIQMVANANPNVNWTRPAAQTVVDYIKGSNQWAMDRQQAASVWAKMHNGSLDGFQEDWNQSRPLTDYIPPLSRINQAFSSGDVTVPKSPSGWSIERAR